MRKMIKWDYILVFTVTLALHFLMLCQTINISMISDYIGDLAAPVTLAGLDWKNLISEVKYYGYGFKWIYFILFKMTDSPYIIYIGIRVFMKGLVALTAILIYHIQIKYLGIKKGFLPMLLAVFLSMQAQTGFNSEGSLFIACWITSFFIVKYINEDEKKIRRALGLSIWLAYTISLHERMTALMISVCMVLVLFRIVYHKWIVNPRVYFPSQIFFYVIIEKITDLYCTFFWSKTTVANTSIKPKNSVWIFESLDNFKLFIDGIISNIVTLNIKTYGLMIVGMAIFVVTMAMLFGSKKKVEEKEECEIKIEKSLHVIIGIFGICIMATICGLSLRWGSMIAGGDMGKYKAFTYHRYYLVYAWPAFMATVLYVYHFGLKKIYKIICIGLFLIFNGYFVVEIGPQLSKVSKDTYIFFERILITDFIRNSAVEVNLSICMLITLVVLLCFVIGKKFRKIYVILGISFIISLSSLTNHFAITVPSISCDNYENVYKVIKQVGEQGNIGTRIFTDFDPYSLQFLLNRYSVENGYPSEAEENILFITKNNYEMIQENLPDYDEYQLVQVKNECIYIKGENLIRIFENCGYNTQKVW